MTPLYRLRWAISRLWLTYAPSLLASRLLTVIPPANHSPPLFAT